MLELAGAREKTHLPNMCMYFGCICLRCVKVLYVWPLRVLEFACFLFL